ALYKLLKTFNVPYVLTWTVDPAGHHTYVGFRNRDAAARVATYLMDIGHCSIAMIAGETAHNDRARDRVIGVQQTLAARGRALDPSALLEAPYSFEAGRDAMRA